VDIHADPLRVLLMFHRSVRAALDTFDAFAAEASSGQVDARKALALHDFFTGPMRWHDVDEHESLLMRLARKDAEAFHAAVRDSIAEHEAVDEAVRSVVRHLYDVAHGRAPADAARLTVGASRLRALLEPHLAREERDVFPRAASVLSAGDLDEMSEEMAGRRAQRKL
jgi:hemerythrin-like domain-containing protein